MVRIEMEMPKDCANCQLVFPVKDGDRTEYFCKLKWQHIEKKNLFLRQKWCPMHEDKEVNRNG